MLTSTTYFFRRENLFLFYFYRN